MEEFKIECRYRNVSVNQNIFFIPKNELVVQIDYPIKKPIYYQLTSNVGFNLKNLINKIWDLYEKLYKEDFKTMTVSEKKITNVKTGEVALWTGKLLKKDKRELFQEITFRDESDGKYGIWGWDLKDLYMNKIVYYPGSNLITLDMDSIVLKE